MAIPVTVQLFDAFAGTQEGIHSVLLPDIFSSGGSKNVYIDKYGRVVRINGYDNQNTSAYTTDTGASAAAVTALIPYRSTSGGSITRKVLFVLDDGTNEWEIWESSNSGVSGTFLYDAGSGSVGFRPDWAQFGDSLYITNGQVVPRVYDGSTISAVGLTQSPTPTAADSGDSGNLIGNYTYKLVSLIGGERQNGSDDSTVLQIVDGQVDLSWTADSDTNVDGYEIYRTTGTGTTFYYLTTIDGRTTVAYTDNTSDRTLLENRVLEEHGDTPPTAYYVEPHRQRMWWLRTDSNPTRAYWSDPGEPESVYAFSFLDFSDSETVGDVITGALGNYEGLFVVFTEKAVWTVSGTGAIIGDIIDFRQTRTNAQTGCATSRSVVRVPAGSKYTDQFGRVQTTDVAALAYWTPQGDIRLFDGDNDLIVSHPVRDTIKGYGYARRDQIQAIHDEERSQFVWVYPSDENATYPDAAVVWNYQYGVWYPWTPLPFASLLVSDTSANPNVFLAGEGSTSTGAFIYEVFSGTSFNGSAIDAQWMTKALYGVNEQGQPALSNEKRWRWMDLLFRIDQDTDVTVGWLNGVSTDDADPISTVTASPDAEALITADGSTIETTDGSSILVSVASAQVKNRLVDASGDYLHDTGIRLRVGSNGTGGAWALEAMQLAYQILPGQRRRFQ